MSQHFFYPPQSASITIPNPLPVTGPLTDTELRATPVPVSISGGLANPLPVTDAAAEASLASIDGKVSTAANQTTQIGFASNTDANVAVLTLRTPTLGQKAMAGSSPVVIASDQSAVPVSAASLPLPAGAATEVTLAAFSSKSAGALVPERFDEQVIAYVGATTRIDTVTYKLAAATVATLTMSYDGSDRLIGVVKT